MLWSSLVVAEKYCSRRVSQGSQGIKLTEKVREAISPGLGDMRQGVQAQLGVLQLLQELRVPRKGRGQSGEQ